MLLFDAILMYFIEIFNNKCCNFASETRREQEYSKKIMIFIAAILIYHVSILLFDVAILIINDANVLIS
jgi:hypothetical protein